MGILEQAEQVVQQACLNGQLHGRLCVAVHAGNGIIQPDGAPFRDRVNYRLSGSAQMSIAADGKVEIDRILCNGHAVFLLSSTVYPDKPLSLPISLRRNRQLIFEIFLPNQRQPIVRVIISNVGYSPAKYDLEVAAD